MPDLVRDRLRLGYRHGVGDDHGPRRENARHAPDLGPVDEPGEYLRFVFDPLELVRCHDTASLADYEVVPPPVALEDGLAD